MLANHNNVFSERWIWEDEQCSLQPASLTTEWTELKMLESSDLFEVFVIARFPLDQGEQKLLLSHFFNIFF